MSDPNPFSFGVRSTNLEYGAEKVWRLVPLLLLFRVTDVLRVSQKMPGRLYCRGFIRECECGLALKARRFVIYFCVYRLYTTKKYVTGTCFMFFILSHVGTNY